MAAMMTHHPHLSPLVAAGACYGIAGIVLLALLRMAPEPPDFSPPPPVAAAKVKAKAADPCPTIRVLFSPRGGCEEAIVQAIDAAQTTIRVQAYSFTSPTVEKALEWAKVRGVDVRATMDDSNANPATSQADELAAAGVPVLIDSKHKISHSKVISIDGHIVITGSFNFTKSAEESNLENLLIIDDRATAARYLENWDQHREHCTPLGGP